MLDLAFVQQQALIAWQTIRWVYTQPALYVGATCLVALEAWSARRPTLATARSEVLAGQTARADGGLLWTDDLSYARQLARLASDPSLRDMLGTRGGRFADGWTWDACVRRWRALLAQVRAPVRGRPRPPGGATGPP